MESGPVAITFNAVIINIVDYLNLKILSFMCGEIVSVLFNHIFYIITRIMEDLNANF